MQYQNNGDSGGSATDACKMLSSEDQKIHSEETFDEFLLQVNAESKMEFQNRIKEFDVESAPKSNSSKFTSRSKLGLDDDIYPIITYQNSTIDISKRPSNVQPLKLLDHDEKVHFDAFQDNSDGKTNQENDPCLMNKGTMEKLMESTAELDRVIQNASSDLEVKRVEALNVAIKSKIQQIKEEEKEIKKCRQEFQVKHNVVQSKLNEKIAQLQKQLKAKEERIDLEKQTHLMSTQINSQNTDFDNQMAKLNQDLKTLNQKQFEKQQFQIELKNQIDHFESQKQKLLSDLETLPLIQQKNCIADQLVVLNQSLNLVKQQISTNFERINMLQEEQNQLELQKISLVFEMEESDQKNPQGDHQIIQDLMNKGSSQLYRCFIANKQNQILTNLIRELQQYMLSINSGKTDASMVNSDQLDDLSEMIQKSQISHQNSVKIICEFAKQKVDCQLHAGQILMKIKAIENQYDKNVVDKMVNSIKIEQQKQGKLAERIKNITKRLSLEIKPQTYALSNQEVLISKQQRLSQKIQSLEIQYKELESKLKIENKFEIKQDDQNLHEIQQEIDNFQKQIDQIKLQQIELKNQNLQLNKDFKDKLSLLSFKFDDSLTISLQAEIQQLALDKDQALNLLEYANKKYENVVQSLTHAQKVLYSENKFSIYGQTQSSRISNVQDQSQNLIRGKILSPSSRKKRLRESDDQLKLRNKQKKQLSPHNSMYEINPIFKVISDEEQQPETPNLSSLLNNQAKTQDMNTSMTTKISNHILDNDIIIRRKPVTKKSSIASFSNGVHTNIHSNINSGITSAMNSGLRGDDEELRLSMLDTKKNTINAQSSTINLLKLAQNNGIYDPYTPISKQMEFQSVNFYENKQYQQPTFSSQMKSSSKMHLNKSLNDISIQKTKNLSMKNLGKATNISSVGNPSQIKKKVRDSLSQNRYFKRDVQDLKVVYELRQNRLRSASASGLVKKNRSNSAISVYNSRQNPREDHSLNQKAQKMLSNKRKTTFIQDKNWEQQLRQSQTVTTIQYKSPANMNRKKSPMPGASRIQKNHSEQMQTAIKKEPKIETKKKITTLEFKRYDPNADELQTFIVKVPENQEKIIQFFTMIKPLIESAKFKNEDKIDVKMELQPNDLTLLKIQNTYLKITDIHKLDLPQATLDEIVAFKENPQKPCQFKFIIKLKNKDQMGFYTQNYNHLKKWTLGVNALVQNQNSLSKLGKMLMKQQ